jgi:hypothetical protein
MPMVKNIDGQNIVWDKRATGKMLNVRISWKDKISNDT